MRRRGRTQQGALIVVVAACLAPACSDRGSTPEAPAASAPPALAPAASPRPVAPPASGTTVLRGTVVLTAEAPRILPCGGNAAVSLEDVSAGALEEAYLALASDENGEMWAQLRGELTAKGLRVHSVERALPMGEGSPCDTAPGPGELRAVGNEPFWAVRVTASALELHLPDLEEPLLFPSVEPVLEGERRTWTSRLEGPSPQELRLSVVPGRCVDSMSGAWSHLLAEATLRGEPVTGCAFD